MIQSFVSHQEAFYTQHFEKGTSNLEKPLAWLVVTTPYFVSTYEDTPNKTILVLFLGGKRIPEYLMYIWLSAIFSI